MLGAEDEHAAGWLLRHKVRRVQQKHLVERNVRHSNCKVCRRLYRRGPPGKATPYEWLWEEAKEFSSAEHAGSIIRAEMLLHLAGSGCRLGTRPSLEQVQQALRNNGMDWKAICAERLRRELLPLPTILFDTKRIRHV